MTGRAPLVLGCAYEIVALTTGRLPTITKLIKALGRYPAGRILVWAWCGFIAWHFLAPDKP